MHRWVICAFLIFLLMNTLNHLTNCYDRKKPIGVFDSGVGGLSVVNSIRNILPNESIIYFADQANVPYGSRPLTEIQSISEKITRYLLNEGVKLIVVACNTASAAALYNLRRKFYDIPFVGMEPAIKPAAEKSLAGKVGVLATPATFQGSLYSTLVERFSKDVTIFEDSCPGLVNQIENGDLKTSKTLAILSSALQPMINEGIDLVVLGCTHYPFVIPEIQKIIGDDIEVIDPSPAVARQTRRLLEQHDLLHPAPEASIATNENIRLITSGNSTNFSKTLFKLSYGNFSVESVEWGINL